MERNGFRVIIQDPAKGIPKRKKKYTGILN